MKSLLLSFLLFSMCCTLPSFAQNVGEISGLIHNQNGQPMEMVSVSFKEINKQTLTNIDGKFNFKGLKPGKYTLVILAYGVPKHTHNVDVNAAGVTTVNYTVTEKSSNALNEVAVRSAVKKFHKKDSEYISRLPLKNLENPQVYSIVSKELMQEQVVTDLGSALKSVPGTGVPLLLNQNRVTFISRGFSVEPKVRNGLSNFVQTSIDPVNLERLEVIKGPSSTLFGSSVVSYGGLINRVTKKPFNGFGGEVSYTAGTWDMSRLAVDFNTPVNESKTALFRMNSAVSSQNSFQDAGFTKSFAITPSFSYQITKNLSLTADIEYGKNQGTSPIRFDPFLTGIAVQKIENLGIPYKQSFANNDVSYDSESKSIFTQVNYRISDQWTSQTAFTSTDSRFDGSTIRLVGTSATTLRPQVTVGAYGYKSTDIQQNFIGDFKLGNLRNRMVVGLDYYSFTTTRKTANINTTAVDFTKDINTTNYYTTFNPVYLNRMAQTANYTNQNGDQKTYSAYVSDVLNVTDRLLAMLSLRADHFENNGTLNVATGANTGVYKQTAFSPKLGLVYQVLKDNLSLFGNYMNGFTNQTGTDIDGRTFKPEQANQVEGGIKIDLWNHKLTGSVSYYDIKVKDIVRSNPANSDFSIQDGTQSSKGIDMELVANPVGGFSILAGYAYNDSKYTNIDPALTGLRPAGSGPARVANFWLSYRLTSGVMHGLGAGVGSNYGSSAFQTNTQSAKVIIPSYTTIDASLFFERKNYRVSFKGNNLTDEKYWSYRLTPQNPVNFLAGAAYKF
jgi:iron complex outermembrane receptor protein